MTHDERDAETPRVDRILKIVGTVTAAYAVAVGVLYVLGYVVANQHYGRYFPPTSSLIHVRYVAAGLLFAGVVAPCATMAAAVFSDRLSPIRNAQHELPRSLRWIILLAFALGSLAATYMLVGLIIVPDAELADLRTTILNFAWWIWCPAAILRWFDLRVLPGPDKVRFSMLFTLMVASGALAFGIPAVGGEIYPRVGPNFGGGAAWEGEVTFVDGAGSVTSATGLVLSSESDQVVILQCTEMGPFTRSVARRLVVEVRSDRLRVAPEYCGDHSEGG